MSRLNRAELLKLTTTRSFWVYVLIVLAVVPLSLAKTTTTPARASCSTAARACAP